MIKNKIMLVLISIIISSLIISGCAETQTFSKEDKIYNPPVTRGDEKQSPSAIINDSFIENEDVGCSEIDEPKNF